METSALMFLLSMRMRIVHRPLTSTGRWNGNGAVGSTIKISMNECWSLEGALQRIVISQDLKTWSWGARVLETTPIFLRFTRLATSTKPKERASATPRHHQGTVTKASKNHGHARALRWWRWVAKLNNMFCNISCFWSVAFFRQSPAHEDWWPLQLRTTCNHHAFDQ